MRDAVGVDGNCIRACPLTVVLTAANPAVVKNYRMGLD